jgi:hypothetical protein
VHLLITAATTTEPLYEPDDALILASLAVSVLTLLAVAVLATATRVREPDVGPATMDPPSRDERPALVGFLARDFEVPTEAIAATLIDLAARRWLVIESAGGDQLVVRVPRREGKGDLVAYERRVLSHVQGLAVGGVVPAGALTTGTEDVSTRWWKDFAGEVVREARDRGLCRDRWPGGLKLLFGAGVVGAGIALWAAGGFREPEEVETGPLWYAALLAILAVIAIGVAIGRSRRQRDTDAGRAEASRWLGLRRFLVDHGDFPNAPAPSVAVWDGYLGWAAALGLAPLAVESLPLGAEDDHHAWSSMGGTWRRVEVRYPRWRPGWGRHPLMAVLTGLLWAAVALLALRGLAELTGSDGSGETSVDRWIDLAAAVVAAVALAVAAFSLAGALCGVADLFRTVEVTGVVLRRRTRGRTSPRAPRFVRWLADRDAPADPPKVRWYLGVDPGDGPTVAAWSVPIGTFDRVGQGTRVRASVTPLLRHMRSIEAVRLDVVHPPSAPAATVDVGGSDPVLVDAAARLAERRFSPR